MTLIISPKQSPRQKSEFTIMKRTQSGFGNPIPGSTGHWLTAIELRNLKKQVAVALLPLFPSEGRRGSGRGGPSFLAFPSPQPSPRSCLTERGSRARVGSRLLHSMAVRHWPVPSGDSPDGMARAALAWKFDTLVWGARAPRVLFGAPRPKLAPAAFTTLSAP